MPRTVSDTGRIELRIDPDAKAKLARAAALEHIDLTAFILRAALPVAQTVIEHAERIQLSERDSLSVLDAISVKLYRSRNPCCRKCLSDQPSSGSPCRRGP